jgi:hypothetical protein
MVTVVQGAHFKCIYEPGRSLNQEFLKLNASDKQVKPQAVS